MKTTLLRVGYPEIKTPSPTGDGLGARLTTLSRKKNIVAKLLQGKEPDGLSEKRPGNRTRTMKNLSMATWNVKTMSQPGKMNEIADEIKKFKINILAVQETRWPGQGRIDKRDYTMFYSGSEARTGQCGTGFMIDKQARKSFMNFEPIDDRMFKIRFRGRFRNTTLISVYAPTEVCSEEEKHTFYNNLQDECFKVPKYDILIILGDFNAQIGTEDFLKDIAGKHTLHTQTNDNGKLLAELATTNNLLIKSTFFDHKRIHKGTWKIPGTQETNQIDHVLVSKRYGSSVIDVKSARGPNCDSDHYMVRIKMKDKLAKVHRMESNKRIKWNVDVLKDSAQIKKNIKIT